MIRTLVLLLPVLLSAPSLAQDAPRQMSLTGQATVAAAPDGARIHHPVQATDKSAARALEKAAAQVAAVSARMTPFGAVETVAPRLLPSPSREKSLVGSADPVFVARAEVILTLADMARAGAALDALDTPGAAWIAYSVEDTAALTARAREEAVADALERARTYARAAGLTLGPILDFTERTDGLSEPHSRQDTASSSYSYHKSGKGEVRDIVARVAVTIRWALE